jgi:polyisoprenoid-binding protein YceI
MNKTMVFLVCAAICGAGAMADTYTVDPSDALFAIVTHKKGAGSVIAHDHLVYATNWKAEMTVDGRDLGTSRFTLRFPTASLRTDTQAISDKWYPVLRTAGIQKKPFAKVSDSHRKLIIEHMLAKNQLNAEKFPEIRAELKSLRPHASAIGDKKFKGEARIALTVVGQTVERLFGVNIEEKDGYVRIETIGSYKFTDFGIKPYSAMLGLMSNEDQFYVLVNFKATKNKDSSKP